MSTRPARPDDAEAIAELEGAAAARPWSLDAVRTHLASEAGEGWVTGAPPVGHLLTHRAADTAEVLTIAVHPDHRQAGHGRALLEAALAHWHRHGVSEAFLEVRTDNAPAQAAYAATGWQPIGRRPRYYDDGCDAVLYRRSLP